MSMTFGGSSYGGAASAVPFERTTDPSKLGMYLNLDQQELVRLQRYREHWRFYFNKHWAFQTDAGDPLVTLNLFRKVIDKSVAFLVSEGINIKVADPLVKVTPPFLMEVWKKNGGDKLLWDMGIMGGVSGDCFVLTTYKEPDALQRRIYPYSKGRILLRLLNSEQVFPTYDPLEPEKLVSVRIETVYTDTRAVQAVGTDTQTSEGRQGTARRYTEVITADTITVSVGGAPPTVTPNVLGEIPLVHIKNLPAPNETYGLPDGMEIIDVQREINEKATDLSDIVNYHASPITVVIGAKAKELERSPRQIWSGLPKEAQVFNLALQGDLGAGKEYLDMLRSMMMELSDTPEGSLGKMHPISNTSGVAMHMQYGPLLEKTKKKRAQYEAGVDRINYFILRIAHVMNLLKLPFDIDKKTGGKIAQVEVPLLDAAGEQRIDELTQLPMMRREPRVFEMNPKTFEFMDPMDMKVRFIREYSFGREIREEPFWQVMEEHRGVSRSFWDPEPETPAEEDTEDAEARAPVDPETGEKVVAPRAVPQMPPDQITIPSEPEEVRIIVSEYSAVTGELVREQTVDKFLVPIEADAPEYLNPYETESVFNDALPKDKHLDAQLYKQYIEMGVASRRWVMENIPDIAPFIDEIERDLEKERAEQGEGTLYQTEKTIPQPQPPETRTELQGTAQEQQATQTTPTNNSKKGQSRGMNSQNTETGDVGE